MEKRTVMCGLVNENLAGQEVVLNGWVQRTRDRGSILFLLLRDREGIVQVTFNEETCSQECFAMAKQLRAEYVVQVKGTVTRRDEAAINEKMLTGRVEVLARELAILNQSLTPPIYIDDDHPDENETVRLKHRYLDLRRPSLQHAIRTRAKVMSVIRYTLDALDFLEIETPILTKSTPEGARDFLVPSRTHPGEFYALPQSPQIYKQLLMLSGFDKYYQIARCFRDEDNRADRQPEFSQLDLEMSFADETDVQSVVEGIYQNIFRTIIGRELTLPLPRISWQEAMDRYGSDKPDRRFGLELVNISDIAGDCGFSVFEKAVEGSGTVRGINAKGCAAKLSRKDIDALGEYVKTFRAKGLAWMIVEESSVRSPIAKFMSEQKIDEIIKRMDAKIGDVLFFVADKNAVALQSLGNLRLEIARRLDLIDTQKHDLFWVVDFPLFEYDEDEGGYIAMHHPFTSSMPQDDHLIEKGDLGDVRARAYDLVLSGIEMGSGSIRIHDPNDQARMFKLLGLPDDEVKLRFGFLLDAFRYGVPPHGGFAFGVDRLMMMLMRQPNLRDVIAFPKAQNGSCLMMETPTPVNDEQLEILGLRLKPKVDG